MYTPGKRCGAQLSCVGASWVLLLPRTHSGHVWVCVCEYHIFTCVERNEHIGIMNHDACASIRYICALYESTDISICVHNQIKLCNVPRYVTACAGLARVSVSVLNTAWQSSTGGGGDAGGGRGGFFCNHLSGAFIMVSLFTLSGSTAPSSAPQTVLWASGGGMVVRACGRA